MKNLNDIGYHSLAALFLYGFCSIALEIPDGPSVLIAGFILYLREVTQEQAKHYDYQVLNRSWFPATWSVSKNLETWIPVIPIIVVAILI